METRTATPHELEKALVLAHRLNEGVKLLDVYKASFNNGVLCVDLINGTPYIIDLQTKSLHTFPSEPRSGTDSLRKRIELDLFMEQLIFHRDRHPYYLSVHSAASCMDAIQNYLEKEPVFIGLDTLSNAGGNFLLLEAHKEEPSIYQSLESALNAIMEREEGLSLREYTSSIRPRSR